MKHKHKWICRLSYVRQPGNRIENVYTCDACGAKESRWPEDIVIDSVDGFLGAVKKITGVDYAAKRLRED